MIDRRLLLGSAAAFAAAASAAKAFAIDLPGRMSDRPVNAKVDLTETAGFQAVKIAGVPDGTAGGLPALHLNGFEWRIFHRPVVTTAAAK